MIKQYQQQLNPVRNKRFLNGVNKIFEKNQIILAYLFGSAVKHKLTPLSDIDIAILFSERIKEKDYFNKEIHLATEIGRLFKIDRVDIINLKTVKNPLLKHRAVFYGKPIFIKDKKIQFKTENQIMKEYEDTKYLRETAFKIMEKHIRQGVFGKATFSPKQEKSFLKYVH